MLISIELVIFRAGGGGVQAGPLSPSPFRNHACSQCSYWVEYGLANIGKLLHSFLETLLKVKEHKTN